jgi:hypothetical protein
MISAVFAALLLAGQTEPVQCSLGAPVTIDYSIPDSYEPHALEVNENFVLLNQNGDSITIVPLVLDTLILPNLSADSNSIVRSFPPPDVTVLRTMPDSVWTVPVFTSPLGHTIPPGFPADYLEEHMFWEKWGRAPSGWLLPVLLLVLLLSAALLFWFFHRKRAKRKTSDGLDSDRKTLSPLDEVKALLDSSAFAEGRWQEYYKDIDMLLRNTVAFRFGISNSAYTWYQIRKQLSTEKGGRKFIDSSEDICREIMLQRYAAWGGSRERAKRYTMLLLSLREEWHRR